MLDFMPVEQPEPMSKDDIMSSVTASLEQSREAYGFLDGLRENAMSYYVGDLPAEAPEGRSQVVSTDVADAINWILPQVIEQYTGKGPIIQFSPNGPGDEQQAELETHFVHHVMFEENDGYANIYQAVKDALMSRNGIFKIWYDQVEDVITESYDGITPQELQMMSQDPNAEIVSAEQTPVGFSVRLKRTVSNGKVLVECIPPEEFFVAAGHNSINLDDAEFCAHITERTAGELIAMGYDQEIIDNAPEHPDDMSSDFRFGSMGESGAESAGDYDKSKRRIQYIEAFIRLDIDQDGVGELVKITGIGDRYQLTELLDIEPITEMPFTSCTAQIMPHKFYGMSIFEQVKEIQDAKTSLWRNLLDNLYLQNNKEKIVLEGQANLDDLLMTRPGGIKRVKNMDAIRELITQPVGTESYQMLEYFDQVRSARVGVAPDMSGQALPVGQDTAHGVERVMTASEALVGLMVRTIAETGLRPAYKKIRDLLVRYQDGVVPFKFNDQWLQVDPTRWGCRSRMSVTVGTVTGNDQRKQAALQYVHQVQASLIQDPRNTLVDQAQIYAALDDFCDSAGLGGADQYFLNPASPQGQQKSQQVAQGQQQQSEEQQMLQQEMVKMQQSLAQAEMAKGQAALQSQQVKIQNAQLQATIEQLKEKLQQVRDSQELRFKYDELATKESLELTKLELEAKNDMSQQYLENKKLEVQKDGMQEKKKPEA